MQDVNDAVVDFLNNLHAKFGITIPRVDMKQLESEVPLIWQKEKFMSLDIKELIDKADEHTKKCIRAHISSIRNKWNHRNDDKKVIDNLNLEPASAIFGKDITDRLKPIITAISESGLVQKIIDTYSSISEKYPNPNEATLAFLIEVVNSQELKDAIYKVDIEKQLVSFNILDILMLTQKLKTIC